MCIRSRGNVFTEPLPRNGYTRYNITVKNVSEKPDAAIFRGTSDERDFRLLAARWQQCTRLHGFT
jgi:hypothetical protein